MKKLNAFKLAVLAPVVMAFGSAHAALPTAVTDGITTAQTDLVALLAALTAAGIAIWVGKVIYNRFSVR